jgi:cytochrome c553
MSEEQNEQNENVGSSLMSALFEKVDTEGEQTQEQSQVDDQPQSNEVNVYGLTDAIAIAAEDQPEPQVEQQEAPQPEKEEEALTKLDKSLFKDIEVGEVGEVVEPEPEPTPEPVQEVVQEEDDLTWLTTDQKKRIELVKFAEDNFDEYKGKKSQYLQFFKDQKDYLDKRLDEDPNAALDDSDYEYQNFLKRKRPEFSQDDLEKVVELRTRKLAKDEAMNELKPELEAIKAEQRRQQVKPRVDSLKEKTMSDVKDMVPDFIKTTIDSQGAKAAYENSPVEFDIVDRIVTTHQKTMFAFHEISNGLTPYDPANKDHVRLSGFIDQLEASMPDRDGKKFVNIAKYQSMSKKDKAEAYTLTHDGIVEYANKSTKKYIAQELNALEAKLRKSGYTKAGRAVDSQQAAIPRPVKPQPRQGASIATPVATEQGGQKNPVLSALGL